MANPPSASSATVAPHSYLGDIFTFNWSEFRVHLPVVCATAVAICLFGGIMAGHPGAALLAGGGAYTIGFGANQRTADSRVLPMLLAIIAVSSASLAGSLAGHRGYALLIAAVISAAIYGRVFPRANGISWVSQQASIALLVASAFPTSLKLACMRAGIIFLGGLVQLVMTTAALHLTPELRRDLLALHRHGEQFIAEVWHLPLEGDTAGSTAYVVRIVLTMAAATWIYLQSGISSGYWIPMTALLVQKPGAMDTLTRATLRIMGTLLGAWLCTLLVAHLHPTPYTLATLSVIFAFSAFATNTVHYGLFSACVTSYIVVLLSLHQVQSDVIAHRRAVCTIAGGAIAVALHLDAIFRQPTAEIS
ncbi:MAG: FUSC family protein [Edaphobacter sp.]|uniref:FUSC family protein n=1 Tax=Edaphobacter sp. TaxID=1934404 RepID=UPI002399F96D|nr:FUSC family protein [Edaphobacter sp.]MDE1177752.1 FUSC family protein [Edaphobacter sp.]